MNKKTCYTAEEALEKNWELGSHSELDDLDDSDDDDDDDDDDEIVPNPRIGDVNESDGNIDLHIKEAGEVENLETEKVENPATETSEENVEQEEKENPQTLIAKFGKHQPRWRQKPPPKFPTIFLGKEFTHPQDEIKDWTSMKYFKLFQKDELNELTSERSKLYIV